MAEVTLPMAAQKLGITRQALGKHLRQGHITARRVGRYYLVDEDVVRQELYAYLSRPGQNYMSKVAPKDIEPHSEGQEEPGALSDQPDQK